MSVVVLPISTNSASGTRLATSCALAAQFAEATASGFFAARCGVKNPDIPA